MTAPVLHREVPTPETSGQRISVVRIAAIVLGLGILAVAGSVTVQNRIGTGDPVATYQVDLLLNDFSPDAIVVPAGTAVTWHFDGNVTHNIIGDGWGTPERAAGTFSHTFAEPGTYDYRCTLHGPMRGRIIVEPAGVS